MSTKHLEDAAHWRGRAEEARRLASQLADPKAQATMLDIAAGYEKIAKHADLRIAAKER